MLKDSSDDDSTEGPIISSLNKIYNDDGNVLFGISGSVDLPSLHPSPVQIFNLWQVFLNNVYPLLKIFHAPTVQQQLLKCASDLTNASPAMHALMFGIYTTAIASMGNEDCIATMNEDKWILGSRYHTGLQYALHRAEFLRTSDITVLKAFTLYIVSLQINHWAIVLRIPDPRRQIYQCTLKADFLLPWLDFNHQRC